MSHVASDTIAAPPSAAATARIPRQAQRAEPVGAPKQPQSPRPRLTVDIDGLAVDHLDEQATIRYVIDELLARRGGLLLTANVDILRQVRRGEHRDVVDGARLVVADGSPLVWASTVLGSPLPGRVTGSALIWSLSAAVAGVGRRVMFVGGAPGSAQRAAQELQALHPSLGPVPFHFPPYGFDADAASLAEVVEAVVAARPDVVFVSLGFPRQEQLALRLQQHLPSTWFVGCGGALAMLAGDINRAPEWMQAAGLEWVHRMASEPRRLARRYLVDDLPYAVGLLARAGLARLRGSGQGHTARAAAASLTTSEPPTGATVVVPH